MSQRSRHKPWFTADNIPQRLAGMAWDPEHGTRFDGWPPVIYDVLEAIELHKGERMEDPVVASLREFIQRLNASLESQRAMGTRRGEYCTLTVYRDEIEMLEKVMERIKPESEQHPTDS